VRRRKAQKGIRILQRADREGENISDHGLADVASLGSRMDRDQTNPGNNPSHPCNPWLRRIFDAKIEKGAAL
jgi:hypothetical protein